MLQIKTIKATFPRDFDQQVNEALADGWTLTRRLTGHDDFVAEMEREIITEAERDCENCKHSGLPLESAPCCFCNTEADKWEAAE